MTVKYVGQMNIPNYTFASTDINMDGTVDDVNRIGNTCFVTDTLEWKIVLPDLTLGDYTLPVGVGNIDIGKVGIDQPVASSTHIAPFNGTQDVAVAGTAEALVGVATYAISLVIVARGTNTGAVYIGNASVDKDTSKQLILSPGNTMTIDAPLGYKIGVHDWYIDADNPTDGVDFIYLK